METIKELQSSLSQIIYSIADLASLKKIKAVVEEFSRSSDDEFSLDHLPWSKAKLNLKKISSFEEEVRTQGNKKITFNELYPFIDDMEDSSYSLDDLLNALN